VFSYHHYKAKPDNSLFDQLLAALKNKYDLQPNEAAFIGNDMYKDIYPAHESGMKTVLFAGDERSLRLHPDRKEVENLKPDATITELKQLKEIFVK
jgi:putative hydrolase of the HAD superfamily